jgi:hypothetical protein
MAQHRGGVVTFDPVGRQLRAQLRERVDARDFASAPRTERRLRVREEALALLRAGGAILPQRELARMVNEVSDEVVGFGPIEFLLKDPGVTEVMVNGPDDVYVEREGRIAMWSAGMKVVAGNASGAEICVWSLTSGVRSLLQGCHPCPRL